MTVEHGLKQTDFFQFLLQVLNCYVRVVRNDKEKVSQMP